MTDKTHYDLDHPRRRACWDDCWSICGRKQMDVLIVSENVGGQAMWSAGIENYLGFIFIPGPELVEKFEEHISTFNIAREFTRITQLARSGELFRVDTEDGRSLTARAVIVATGKSPRTLGVPGEKEYAGRGVTYCATCDGPLFAGQEVAVVVAATPGWTPRSNS